MLRRMFIRVVFGAAAAVYVPRAFLLDYFIRDEVVLGWPLSPSEIARRRQVALEEAAEAVNLYVENAVWGTKL